MKKYNVWLPALFGLCISIGILIGTRFPNSHKKEKTDKLSEVVSIIKSKFIDTISTDKLLDDAITQIMNDLDPHSYYIPSSQIRSAMMDVQSSFEGIGVEFNVLNDTVIVIRVIPGGPSDQTGIKAGDQIIVINKENVAGKNISSDDVRNKLLGKSGSTVEITVLRNKTQKLNFKITRGRIPVESIDAAMMIDKTTGYIKISKFAENTGEEFHSALLKLKGIGMKDLILDLENNPGGVLTSAAEIAGEFFPTGTTLFYTEGRKVRKITYKTQKDGIFISGKVVVMIDEGSASASEIVAGAIQDLDRGIIIGRRSFGKGLVQDQFPLSDKSLLRLTVARYYTPSGRCIQRPYNNGNDDYYSEVYHRFTNGEIFSGNNKQIPDSLIFKTKNGRKVFGGGGITPDIYIPMDTLHVSSFYREVMNSGQLYRFALDYSFSKKAEIQKSYPDVVKFNYNFQPESMFKSFVNNCTKNGITASQNDLKVSGEILKSILKSLIARQIYGEEAYFIVRNPINKTYTSALKTITSTSFSSYLQAKP